MNHDGSPIAINIRNVVKRYGHVMALTKIPFDIREMSSLHSSFSPGTGFRRCPRGGIVPG